MMDLPFDRLFGCSSGLGSAQPAPLWMVERRSWNSTRAGGESTEPGTLLLAVRLKYDGLVGGQGLPRWGACGETVVT